MISRKRGVEGLGEIASTSNIEPLKQGLEDNERVVRLASAIALCKLNYESGRDFLEETFDKGNTEERVRVIGALPRLDFDWTINIVKLVKTDRNKVVRTAANFT